MWRKLIQLCIVRNRGHTYIYIYICTYIYIYICMYVCIFAPPFVFALVLFFGDGRTAEGGVGEGLRVGKVLQGFGGDLFYRCNVKVVVWFCLRPRVFWGGLG